MHFYRSKNEYLYSLNIELCRSFILTQEYDIVNLSQIIFAEQVDTHTHKILLTTPPSQCYNKPVIKGMMFSRGLSPNRFELKDFKLMTSAFYAVAVGFFILPFYCKRRYFYVIFTCPYFPARLSCRRTVQKTAPARTYRYARCRNIARPSRFLAD